MSIQRGLLRFADAVDAVTGRVGRAASWLYPVLVAVLVAVVKLGDMVEVSVGPGLLAFATCVGLSGTS